MQNNKTQLTSLDALEASEVLKPSALKERVTLDKETLKALESALPILMKDASTLKRAAAMMKMRRADMLGAKQDKLRGDAEEYLSRDEEDAYTPPTRTISYTSGYDNLLDSYIYMTETCLDSIRKALDTDTMSRYDVERIPRYMATLSQYVVREGLSPYKPFTKGKSPEWMIGSNNKFNPIREILDEIGTVDKNITLMALEILRQTELQETNGDVEKDRPASGTFMALPAAVRLALLVEAREVYDILDISEEVRNKYPDRNAVLEEYNRIYMYEPDADKIIRSEVNMYGNAYVNAFAEKNPSADTAITNPFPKLLTRLQEQERTLSNLSSSTDDYEEERAPYKNASALMDMKYGTKDAYVVSRRIVDKYWVNGTLEELDGRLNRNAVTGKTTDISLFEKIPFEYDGENGTRHLTPAGLLMFMDKLKPAEDQISAGLASEDEKLLATALASMKMKEDKDLGIPKEVTALAEGVARMTGCRPSEGESPADRADRLLDNLQKVCEMGYRPNNAGKMLPVHNGLAAIADEIKSGTDAVGKTTAQNLPDLLKRLIQYFGTRSVWMSCKTGVLNSASSISFEDERSADDHNRNAFPYVDKNGNDVNPFADMHQGHLATLATSADLAVMRLEALPLEYLSPDTAAGRAIGNDVKNLKERYMKISASVRKDLSPFMEMDTDEAVGKVADAIKDAQMTADENGWFWTDPNNKGVGQASNSRILGSALKRALISIHEEDPEILSEAMKLLKEESGNESVRNIENRTVRREKLPDGSVGDLIAVPPSLQDSTPVSRFALLTGHYITHEDDEVIPEGEYGYYEDGNASINSYLECAGFPDLIKDKRKTDKNADQKYRIAPKAMLYEVRRFASLCEEARKNLGKESRIQATEILEGAETEAKNLFLSFWRRNFMTLKSSWALCYQDLDDKGATLMETLRDQGHDYGDAVLRRLASKTLANVGLDADAQSAEKDSVEDMTPAARYVCSQYASVICEDSIRKISTDMAYNESKNSRNSDWNRWNDLRKEGPEYEVYSKSTIPFMDVRSMRRGLMKHFGNERELLDAAVLYGSDRHRDRAVQTVRSIIEKNDELLRKNAETLGNAFDPDVNRREVTRLRRAVLTFTTDPDAPYTARDALVQIEVNNPEDKELCGRIREILDGPNFSFTECRRCLDIIDGSGMIYMSPYSRMNSNLSSGHLMEKDRAWCAGKHAEHAAMEAEIEGRFGLPSETLARIWIGIASEMNPETSGARYIAENGALERKDPSIGDGQVTDAIRSAMKSLEDGIGNAVDDVLRKEFSALGGSILKSKGDIQTGILPSAKIVQEAPNIKPDYNGEKKISYIKGNGFFTDMEKSMDLRISDISFRSLSLRDKGFNSSINKKKGIDGFRGYSDLFPSITEKRLCSDDGYREIFRNMTRGSTKTWLPTVVEKVVDKAFSGEISLGWIKQQITNGDRDVAFEKLKQAIPKIIGLTR